MLHNHYYHLNLSRPELDAYINTIGQLAHQLTEHAAIVLSPIPISPGHSPCCC